MAVLGTRRFDGNAQNDPARYRGLKRLANSARDGDRELEFFAGEIRSTRFMTDFPLPLATVQVAADATWRTKWLRYAPFVFWRAEAWTGCARFWFGVLFGWLSDFGRSVLRPFVLWAIVMLLAAAAYLGQHPDVMAARERAETGPGLAWLTTYARATWQAYRGDQPCWAGIPDKPDPADASKTLPSDLTGLRPPVSKQTTAAAEALRLAVANATIIGGQDGSHRTYGCLFGIERYGDNPVAHVPGAVSAIAAAQKVFSALFIFLFGLAIRNMLKMK